MHLVKIDSAGIDECYELGIVKPNEYRQICMNLLERELQLRLEAVTPLQFIKSLLSKENYFLNYYQELSDCKEDLIQCIMNIVVNSPELLLITEEEARKLFLSHIFYKKALLVRDCSDIFRNSLVSDDVIYVDKETLRAIEYLKSHPVGAKALLKELYV